MRCPTRKFRNSVPIENLKAHCAFKKPKKSIPRYPNAAHYHGDDRFERILGPQTDCTGFALRRLNGKMFRDSTF